jgi:hypothetical protein
MNRVRLTCLALLISAICGAALTADEVYLIDGRVIEGEVISTADAEVVDIRVSSGGLVAIQHFPRTKIQRVAYGVSARQTAVSDLRHQVDSMAKRNDATAADWWPLARRLQDRGETALARDVAMRVVALDRDHPEARRLLGMVQYRGVWMKPNEAAVARGEVFFRGAWVTWNQQEQTLAEEARRREEQAIARKERDEQRRQARIAAAAAAESLANSAALQETYVGGYYRSPYYNPYGGGGWYYTGTYPGYGGGYPIGRPPVCGSGGVGWHIGATGGGSNHAWGFSWNGFSSASSSSSGFGFP